MSGRPNGIAGVCPSVWTRLCICAYPGYQSAMSIFTSSTKSYSSFPHRWTASFNLKHPTSSHILIPLPVVCKFHAPHTKTTKFDGADFLLWQHLGLSNPLASPPDIVKMMCRWSSDSLIIYWRDWGLISQQSLWWLLYYDDRRAILGEFCSYVSIRYSLSWFMGLWVMPSGVLSSSPFDSLTLDGLTLPFGTSQSNGWGSYINQSH